MAQVRITDNELHEIATAAGTLMGAAELLIEGKMLTAEGEKRLNRAIKLLDKWDVSDEELGLYVNKSYRDDPKRSAYVYSKLKGWMH